MEKTRRSLFLGTISLLIVLGLLTGCYRPAASDVTETPAGGAETALSDEDMWATAAAESTRVQPHLEGKEVVKEIYVPGRLVNFVVH